MAIDPVEFARSGGSRRHSLRPPVQRPRLLQDQPCPSQPCPPHPRPPPHRTHWGLRRIRRIARFEPRRLTTPFTAAGSRLPKKIMGQGDVFGDDDAGHRFRVIGRAAPRSRHCRIADNRTRSSRSMRPALVQRLPATMRFSSTSDRALVDAAHDSGGRASCRRSRPAPAARASDLGGRIRCWTNFVRCTVGRR